MQWKPGSLYKNQENMYKSTIQQRNRLKQKRAYAKPMEPPRNCQTLIITHYH